MSLTHKSVNTCFEVPRFVMLVVFGIMTVTVDPTRPTFSATIPVQEKVPGETVLTESVEPIPPIPAATPEDALARARLLHETIKGALLVVHRDFFDDENPHILPSQSLEDVFEELARTQGVQVRWLTVDADELSFHHRPQNEFEKQAIEKLKTGVEQYSGLTGEQFQYVGRIPLANQCLKCHVKLRLNLKERAAGLSITVPVKPMRYP